MMTKEQIPITRKWLTRVYSHCQKNNCKNIPKDIVDSIKAIIQHYREEINVIEFDLLGEEKFNDIYKLPDLVNGNDVLRYTKDRLEVLESISIKELESIIETLNSIKNDIYNSFKDNHDIYKTRIDIYINKYTQELEVRRLINKIDVSKHYKGTNKNKRKIKE